MSKPSAERRQRTALEQGEASVAALQELGVKAELVGSVVWREFHAASDIDILIIDDGGVRGGVIYEAVASRVNIEFDLIFLHSLRPVSRDFIIRKRAEHGRATIESRSSPGNAGETL